MDLLIRLHQDRVFGLVQRLVPDRHRAAELAQEVFVKALKGLGGFRGEAQFRTWLYQIALNVTRSELRQQGRGEARTVPLTVLGSGSGDEDGGSLEPADAAEGPEARLAREERAARVRSVLDSLEPELRELILLRDGEGLDYAHVARVTGLALGTVKSMLHRARLKFMERFQRVDPERAG